MSKVTVKNTGIKPIVYGRDKHHRPLVLHPGKSDKFFKEEAELIVSGYKDAVIVEEKKPEKKKTEEK